MGNKATLSAYTFSHFVVDFCCFHILYALVLPAAPSLALASTAFLVYNTVAFGLQALVGFWCDARPPIAAAAAPLGCALVLAALALATWPLAAMLTAALGNTFFHVGGGMDALTASHGKMARSGVFVSSGALGVSLGTFWGTGSGGLLLPLGLAACAFAACLWCLRVPRTAATGLFYDILAPRTPGLLILLFCAAIVVRAFAAGLVPLPWRTGPVWALLPGIAAFGGKLCGGFLADAAGPKTAGVLSLCLCVPLLCFGNASPLAAALGLFMFNMNMPVTLCALARCLPQNPGLAFGLSTLALLCGTAPLFALPTPAGHQLPFALLCAFSALCLSLGLRGKHKAPAAAPGLQ